MFLFSEILLVQKWYTAVPESFVFNEILSNSKVIYSYIRIVSFHHNEILSSSKAIYRCTEIIKFFLRFLLFICLQQDPFLTMKSLLIQKWYTAISESFAFTMKSFQTLIDKRLYWSHEDKCQRFLLYHISMRFSHFQSLQSAITQGHRTIREIINYLLPHFLTSAFSLLLSIFNSVLLHEDVKAFSWWATVKNMTLFSV